MKARIAGMSLYGFFAQYDSASSGAGVTIDLTSGSIETSGYNFRIRDALVVFCTTNKSSLGWRSPAGSASFFGTVEASGSIAGEVSIGPAELDVPFDVFATGKSGQVGRIRIPAGQRNAAFEFKVDAAEGLSDEEAETLFRDSTSQE
jgi:hypothetical protein